MGTQDNIEKISIIIPCRNEEKYISQCLDSVINSTYPKDKMEILIVDGISNDQTKKIVYGYCREYQNFKLFDNPGQTVPKALNIGIKESTGDYIIRLDTHSKFPPDYFSKLIYWSKNLNADNVGAVCITDVLNVSKKSLSIKKVLSHPVGVGNAYFRVGARDISEVDTVPFGCFKREIFSTIGFFNEKLSRNQDIEFNKRLKENGKKIYLVPEVTCTYYARETYTELAKNNFQNGLWNVSTVYITKKMSSLSIRHFIPLIFVLSILLPAILSFIQLPFIFLSFVSLLAHFILILNISIKLNDKETNIFYLLKAFYTLHLSYGIGSLTGLFRLNKLRI